MFRQLRGLFSEDLCIDLGTANTLIYARGRGIVLNEASVIAVRRRLHGGQSIAAVGEDAKRMLGRTPGDISTIRPLHNGVIADFTVTREMLQHFARKVHQGWLPHPSPRVIMAVPVGATSVERRALREAAEAAGARAVYLMEEPVAAAIGAGLPVSEARGSMVVDIGGGTTEVAVISLNSVVYAQSLRVGGYFFDEAIANYVRRNHCIIVGEPTAERIKQEVGYAYPPTTVSEIQVHGSNIAEGAPRKFAVNSNEVHEALQEPLSRIVEAVVTALEETPPELGSDLVEQGIVLTGGGALLKGLARLLAEETGISVRVADDPLTCVARGGGMALEQLDAVPTAAFLSQKD